MKKTVPRGRSCIWPGRSLLRLLFLFPLILILLPGEATLQEKDPTLCPKCKTTGKIENKYFTSRLLDMESRVLHCSWIMQNDKKGNGVSWLPCRRCRNPGLEEAARAELAKIIARNEKWLARRRDVDERLKTKLLHVETEHFIIAWSIPKIVTSAKKTYKSHEALHLYADRLEAFYTDFMTFFKIDPKQIRNSKHFIYLFEKQKHCLKASSEYTGLNSWNAAKLPGNPSILVSWLDKTNIPTDDDLHRHLVHHVSHLLNVSYYRMEWLAATAGWADEGLGHFFEYKYFGRADNTCDEEGEEEALSHSDWEYEVRQGVESGGWPSFAEICNKSTTALHGRDHQLAWSYVDFLLKKKEPARFLDFMKAIKAKKPCRDAMKEAYSLNVITFQKQWEEFVLATYRDKPLMKKGARSRRSGR